MHIDIDSIVDTYKYAYILIHIYIYKYIYISILYYLYIHMSFCIAHDVAMDGAMAPHQAKHLDMELFQRLLKQAVKAPDFMGEA